MRLLYVEDERLIRESVAKQIQKMFPLEVFTACHGAVSYTHLTLPTN